jgi:EipB-like
MMPSARQTAFFAAGALQLIAVLLPWPVQAAAASEAIVLSPHRAIYDFKLGKSTSGGGISDMTGRMVYELTGSACDGYTQTMRFVTRATSQDGGNSVNDMRSTSFEEGGGKSLRFTFNQYRDDKLSETTTGDAKRETDTIKVDLEKPKRTTLQLKPDVMFPIQHSIRLLEAAQRDETVLQADLYDGSDKGEKVYSTTAVIGRSKPRGHNAALAKVENSEKLDGMRSWPVALSYFEPGGGATDAVPSYELAFLFFENGVVRQLTLDYGDFALKGDLKSITFLEPSQCKRQ